MRELTKGLSSAVTPPPEGVTPEWVSELKRMLAEAYVIGGTNLSGSNLDSAEEFVLRGEAGTWVHPVPPGNTTRGTRYRSDQRPEQPGFYAALWSIPGDILLRWAQVLEAMAYLNQHSRLYIPFPGNVHWPELVLVYGSGSSLNSWPPSTLQRIAYSTIEKMLVAAGMEPHLLLVGAFATPVDSGYGAESSLGAVSYCPDFAQALDRHIEAVRPLLLAGGAGQRVYVLTMLTRATPHVLDKFAPEIAELAVSSAKQVRVAADGFVQSAGPVMVPVLRRLATAGKPEQRLYALRHLYQRGQKCLDAVLCDFARATAAVDKAPSVQALIGQWQAEAAADAAPEANYDFEVPSIPWPEGADASVSARLDKLWHDMNGLIRADNQRSREHYERYKSQHGQPKWPLRQHDELGSDWLEDLKAFVGSGSVPPKEGPRPGQVIWVALTAIRNLAGESVLKPTQLFKILQYVGHLVRNDDGRFNHLASDCFNRLYAGTGRPTLIELATMIRDIGRDPVLLLNAFCSGRFGSIARGWRSEDVWPFVAQHVPVIERHLQGLEQTDHFFERSRLYDAIATLPIPPPRIVNALFAVALGQGKSERKQAQAAVANLPDKEARVISALSDGKSEIRAIAAQWLGKLKFSPALGALEKAVAAEKHDNTKGAMLDALEALGQPVGKYLKRDLLLPEAQKALAKGPPKELSWVPWDSLPQVQWADTGYPVAPEVLKWMIVQACRANSPEPNAVLRKYCAMFEPHDRERFGQWVLDQWLVEDVAPIAADDAHQRALAQAQSMHRTMKSHPQYFQNNPHLGRTVQELTAAYLPGFLRQPKGSAIGSKGMLAVAAACAGERAAAPIARYIKEWYGTRASQGKALVAMLAWIDHPSATQVMLAIGNRFRTKSIQEEAARQAEALADRKGWTLAELADRTIPTAGFDENGELELPYGPRIFKARLLPDFKIELFNPEGKKIASLPEPRQDDDEALAKASRKSLSAGRKEIKSIVDLQTDRLYEALCTGRDWSCADWNTYLNGHPVVRHLVQRLVWLQESESGGRSAFRPLADGTLTNEADDAVQAPEHVRIRLAHDTLLTQETVQRWQQHLIDYEIKPLFQQLGKGTYELPNDKANYKEVTDFKGHLLEAFALRGRASKLGYQRGSAQDGGLFSAYEKRFPTLGLTAVVEFTGNTLPEENRTVALVGLVFSSSSKENSWERGDIPLNKIPKVLLSECYNDLRLIAAEGTGFDPEWEKKSAY
jgi:Domain of unknown function (DUF4132)